MKIYLSSDHTGYELKEKLKKYFSELENEVVDKGPSAYNKEDDYPDFVKPMAEAVVADPGSFGVVVGGSGQGEAMCANRVKGARAVVFYSQAMPQAEVDIKGTHSNDSFEIIKLAREHNDANILSLSDRFLSEDEIKFAIELFTTTQFSGEERHQRRIQKLDL